MNDYEGGVRFRHPFFCEEDKGVAKCDTPMLCFKDSGTKTEANSQVKLSV